jgi:hypothetical protein
MSYWGYDADECDFAAGSIDTNLLIIKDNMLRDMENVKSKKFPEQSALASLDLLRLVGEKYPKNLRVVFSKKEYEVIKSDFFSWHDDVKNKIPKKYREDFLKQAAKVFEDFEGVLFANKVNES